MLGGISNYLSKARPKSFFYCDFEMSLALICCWCVTYCPLSCSLVRFWTPTSGESIGFTGITTLCPETPGWVMNVGFKPIVRFWSHGMVDRASAPIKYGV